MNWIFFSLLYAIFNAIYVNYNAKYHFNGYVLGIVRGFGISFLLFPLIFTTNLNLSFDMFLVLVLQGVLIGFYDSHIFFASSLYGGHTTYGFMSLSVIVTLLLWWSIRFNDLEELLNEGNRILTLCLIVSAITVSYWQMMKVHIKKQAEAYLYPLVFALALMSIATRYIALYSTNIYDGIIYYLTISCFISGIYNLIMYLIFVVYRKPKTKIKAITFKPMFWLVIFSMILIASKSIALREANNPSYVVALLLLSPIIADIIKYKRINLNYNALVFLCFIVLLILFSKNN